MHLLSLLLSTVLFLTVCSSDTNKNPEEAQVNVAKASIESVIASGNENNYSFTVGISSPDTGCEQYANWWEVITEDGSTLLYRRILGHSHVNEQPFVRSGGTAAISQNQIVIIRAHMNTSGYGTTVFKGSVSSGFKKGIISKDFASDLAVQEPLPNGCAF